jgi:hypothetical protein
MLKKIFSTTILLVVMLGFATLALAQDKAADKAAKPAKPKKMTLSGHIVDKACSAGRLKAADPMASAAGHTKACALKESCLKSGLGLFADGKYYEFDEAGTQLAKAALEKSAAEKGAMFKVQGAVSEGKMTVKKIQEAKAKS